MPLASVRRLDTRARGPAALDKLDARSERVREAQLERRAQLHYDIDSRGTHWVRGSTYKASFGAEGATYIPFLGSDAPRAWPIHFALAAAECGGEPIALQAVRGASRDGQSVTIERGLIDEVYELALDSIEQTFVIEEWPGSGDLRLFVDVETEAAPRESQAGFEFENERGAVRYGRAFARAADGEKRPLESRWVEGGIEIRVSAEELAAATFPLVIDPVISTFVVDDNPLVDHFEADVAHDGSTGRYLVLYEEIFSAVDHDVWSNLLDSSGTWIVGAHVDFTTENWLGPKCANLNGDDMFLVAANVNGIPGVPGYVIRGRTITSSYAFGPMFDISNPQTEFGDKFFVDIGGDPFPVAGGHFCVVWTRYFAANDTDIHARLVGADGSLFGSTILVDNSGATLDEFPSVSKSNGNLANNAFWSVAWHRNAQDGTPTRDVRAARISWSGTVLTGSFPIVTFGDTAYATASSPRDDGTYMVGWMENYGSNHDIACALISAGTVLDIQSVTGLDAPTQVGEDQVEPVLDSDGEQFVMVYAQSYQGSTFDYDVYLTPLYTVGNDIRLYGGREVLDFSVERDMRPELVATWGAGGTRKRFFAIWDETASSQRDIRGALYETPNGGPVSRYCFGDGSSGTSCPCGNNGSAGRGCAHAFNPAGAFLTFSGAADVSNDTLQLQGSGMPPNVPCTFFQGTASSSPTAFGDGLRCVGGTLIRLKTRTTSSQGSANFPQSGDASITVAGGIGAGNVQRFYQVNYRNAASFCTPAAFNITNGVQATWLP